MFSKDHLDVVWKTDWSLRVERPVRKLATDHEKHFLRLNVARILFTDVAHIEAASLVACKCDMFIS